MIKSPGTGTQGIVRSPLVIRNFRGSDLQPVMELVEGTFNEHYDPNLYLSLAKKWPDGLMVAEAGDQIVKHVPDRDRLRLRGHPLGRHHDRKSFYQVPEDFERGGA